MSQKIIDGGWGIGCILPELDAIFKGDNFDGKLNPTSRNGDLQFRQAYFGRSAHPYEILFVKTERNLFPVEYLNRLAFSMLTSRLRDSISGIFQSSYLNTLTGVGKSSLRVPIEVCVFKFRDLINCLLFKYKFKK